MQFSHNSLVCHVRGEEGVCITQSCFFWLAELQSNSIPKGYSLVLHQEQNRHQNKYFKMPKHRFSQYLEDFKQNGQLRFVFLQMAAEFCAVDVRGAAMDLLDVTWMGDAPMFSVHPYLIVKLALDSYTSGEKAVATIGKIAISLDEDTVARLPRLPYLLRLCTRALFVQFTLDIQSLEADKVACEGAGGAGAVSCATAQRDRAAGAAATMVRLWAKLNETERMRPLLICEMHHFRHSLVCALPHIPLELLSQFRELSQSLEMEDQQAQYLLAKRCSLSLFQDFGITSLDPFFGEDVLKKCLFLDFDLSSSLEALCSKIQSSSPRVAPTKGRGEKENKKKTKDPAPSAFSSCDSLLSPQSGS
jgi:hypothetical protein